MGGGTPWGSGDGTTSTSSYDPTYGPIAYPYTQTFDLRSDKDLNVQITETVHDWYSGSIVNSGLVVKWEESIEFNTSK